MVNAISQLMGKGITNFVDCTAQVALEHALSIEETARKVIESGIGDVKSWQYIIDHADDHLIIETNGHHIIATWYESCSGSSYCMATYGDYETYEEMKADFDAWKIAKDAVEIADEWEKKLPNEYPRAMLLALATSELKAAYAPKCRL